MNVYGKAMDASKREADGKVRAHAVSPESRLVALGDCRNELKRKNKVGGADGIVSGSSKKTQEKPLINIRFCCHLLILALSLGGAREPSRHPHNARIWQQLATVNAGCGRSAGALFEFRRGALRTSSVAGSDGSTLTRGPANPKLRTT